MVLLCSRYLEMSHITMREHQSVTSIGPFRVTATGNSEPFWLGNDYLTATFDSDGFLKKIGLPNGNQAEVSLQFVYYGARDDPKSSGAYLFIPDGPAKPVQMNADHHTRMINGSIRSQVVTHMPQGVHQVAIHHSPGVDGLGFHIDNLVDITNQDNDFELAMRLVTNIESGSSFFSDLNGLQACFYDIGLYLI